jgi:hypothetical protein
VKKNGEVRTNEGKRQGRPPLSRETAFELIRQADERAKARVARGDF